jgi:hypothetical protein
MKIFILQVKMAKPKVEPTYDYLSHIGKELLKVPE